MSYVRNPNPKKKLPQKVIIEFSNFNISLEVKFNHFRCLISENQSKL